MKNIVIAVLVFLLAGGAYYFWTQMRTDSVAEERRGTQIQVEVNKNTDTEENTKYIPPDAVMEDGTI